MSNPENLKYHESHTWLQLESGDIATVGVTQHAQEQLGDVVYVQPPDIETKVQQGDVCGVIESVKTVADVHAPASGLVIEVNTVLADKPDLINADPYSAWLFRMRLADPTELNVLLNATAYGQVAGD